MNRKFELLRRLHAVDRTHSKTSLMDHLAGTSALLKAWHAEEEICDGGLFHAVYGTESYSRSLLPPTLREDVRDVIGEKAEFLAFAFGAMKKATFYPNLDRVGNFTVTSRFDDTIMALSEEEFVGLCHISVANWLEQRDRASVTDRHLCSEEFRKMLPLLNEKARVALIAAYGF